MTYHTNTLSIVPSTAGKLQGEVRVLEARRALNMKSDSHYWFLQSFGGVFQKIACTRVRQLMLP